jgi:hypothetical protein
VPEMTVDFYVYCSCGAHLSSNTRVERRKGFMSPCVVVEPCAECIKQSYRDRCPCCHPGGGG